MQDNEARREIAEIKHMLARLSSLEQIQVGPPLRMDRAWGTGSTLMLDQQLLDLTNTDPQASDWTCIAITDTCTGLPIYLNVPTSWLTDTCSQCASGSGVPVVCPCEDAVGPYCADMTAATITDNGCNNCEALNRLWTLNKAASCQYFEAFSWPCTEGSEFPMVVTLSLDYFSSLGVWVLTMSFSSVLGNITWESSTDPWDCLSPLVLTLASLDGNDGCSTFPATVTVAPCSGSAEPTVTEDTSDVCLDATTLTIAGTDFTSPASSNTVDLRDSLNFAIAHTVVSGSSTSLTMTLDSPPIGNAGPITAVVTNVNGDSGSPIQVGNAVSCVPVRTALGTQDSGGTSVASIEKSVALVDGWLWVNLATLGASISVDVTVDGVALGTFSGDENLTGVIAGTVGIVGGPVTAGLRLVKITSTGANAAMAMSLVEVTNEFFDAADLGQANHGLASAPSAGAGTTAFADEFVQGAFLLATPGAGVTWSGGFTSGAQDVSMTVGAIGVVLTEGYKILSSIASVNASLSSPPTPAAWAGIQAGVG